MIKRLRRVGGVLGKFVDAEDRAAIGMILVWVAVVSVAIVTVLGSVGLGWRLFELARG